ncbi:hypothetical protein [Streptomyces sp. NPDC047028]|uniref:hypothetical protein n=1 Tax=Streptomyces sp. NPDC047028 TaxID=3155793 RepID=UPI00340F8167
MTTAASGVTSLLLLAAVLTAQRWSDNGLAGPRPAHSSISTATSPQPANPTAHAAAPDRPPSDGSHSGVVTEETDGAVPLLLDLSV